MARPLRAPSETLTPVKKGGKHPHLGNLPLVEESPLHIVNLEDGDSKEQEDENDSGDAGQSGEGLVDGVKGQYVMRVDLSAEVVEEEQAENGDVGQEASTDQEGNGDLMKAGSRLIRVSGHVDKITAQLLQEEPTSPRGPAFWTNASRNLDGTSEEFSGSEAEAERSAARLNAVTHLSLRSRKHSSAQPTNLKGSKRTTTAAHESTEGLPPRFVAVRAPPTVHPSTARSTENTGKHLSRLTRAARKATPSISTLDRIPGGTTATSQNLSPGKRKRGAEAGPSNNGVSGGSQAAKKHISMAVATELGGSRSKRLARPARTYNDMNKVVPSKIQKAAPGPRADLYAPQLSLDEVKATAKQPGRSIRSSSANSKKLQAMSVKSPAGTRAQRVSKTSRNRQHSKPEQQEEAERDEVLGAEEDDAEITESIHKLQRVPSGIQVKPPAAASSTMPTGRATRSNPTGDRTLSQNPTRELIADLVSSGSKIRNTVRMTAQKVGPRRSVAKVAPEGLRISTRTEKEAGGGVGDIMGSSRHESVVTEAGEQHGIDQQRSPNHPHENASPHGGVGQRNGHGVKAVVPVQEPPDSSGQTSDAEDSGAGDVVQSEEDIDTDDQPPVAEPLKRIINCVNSIRNKRREPAFKCETKNINEFLSSIRAMRSVYVKLAKQEQGTDLYCDLCEDLERELEDIEEFSNFIELEKIGTVPVKGRRDNFLKDKRATLQDLYIWAIPDIVITIATAMKAYGDGFISTPEILRIMKLQRVVIRLSDEKWTHGVRLTKKSNGYVNQVRRVLLPYTEELRKGYAKELKERRLAKTHRLEVDRQRRRAAIEREHAERLREIKRRRRIIHEQVLLDLARTDPKYGGKRYGGTRLSASWRERSVGSSSSSTQGSFPGNKPNEWPEAELLALVQGLEKFTGKDRYAQIVREHCGPGGVLQSRSMDELFEKAKEFKADVCGDWELHPDDGPLPDYILSI